MTPSHSPPASEPYPVPAGRFRGGRVQPPSSKSLTQRYLDLALIARRPLRLRRPLLSEDPRLFLAALEKADFEIHEEGDDVVLQPSDLPTVGGEVEIFCGNGGTMFRFLTAALTVVPGNWRLDGVPRLRERPVGPLVEALRQLGASVSCPRREGYAPLKIQGGTLRGGRAKLDAGASSQYLSALLMAGLGAAQPVEVELEALVSEPYVDLTHDAIADFGGRVERRGDVFLVEPTRLVPPGRITVEADFSAAAYPAAAAALCGPAVTLEGVRSGSRQGDRGFVDLLARMGAGVRWESDRVEVTGGELRALDVDLSSMPDQVPTLAALAPFARGTTRITGVAHLRIKESDRLAAMSSELTRLGAQVEERSDGLVIPGVWAEAVPPANEVEVDTWHDHRIAMGLALVGLRRPGVVIRDPGVVGKSYPEFWDHLESLLGDEPS